MSQIKLNYARTEEHGFAIYKAVLDGVPVFDLHVRVEEGKDKHRVYIAKPDSEILFGTKGFTRTKENEDGTVRFSTDRMRHLVRNHSDSLLVQLYVTGEDFDGWYPPVANMQTEDEGELDQHEVDEF